MRSLLVLPSIILLGLGTASADEKKVSLADLSWLSGSWTMTADGAETEEYWMPPKGGLMLGLNRTSKPKEKSHFEFMRIEERDSGIVFIALPSGKPGEEFPLLETGPKHVVFENKKVDFPRRISYKLDAKNRLTGRIDGEIEGKPASMQWTWDRAK